jgi:hypothetical protein
MVDREEALERAGRYGGSDAEKICHGKNSFRLCRMLFSQIKTPVCFFIINFRVVFKAEHIFILTDYL